MFGLGFSEIVTIVVVIIVFMNPKDLPIIVRKIGVVYGKIMRQINQVKRTFHDYEEEIKSISQIEPSGKTKSWQENEKLILKGDKK